MNKLKVKCYYNLKKKRISVLSKRWGNSKYVRWLLLDHVESIILES